jgi:hypothetical protein
MLFRKCRDPKGRAAERQSMSPRMDQSLGGIAARKKMSVMRITFLNFFLRPRDLSACQMTELV